MDDYRPRNRQIGFMCRAGGQRTSSIKESTSRAGSKQPNGESASLRRWSRRYFPVQQRVYRANGVKRNLRGRT